MLSTQILFFCDSVVERSHLVLIPLGKTAGRGKRGRESEKNRQSAVTERENVSSVLELWKRVGRKRRQNVLFHVYNLD